MKIFVKKFSFVRGGTAFNICEKLILKIIKKEIFIE